MGNVSSVGQGIERRGRDAQRAAVAELLPESGSAWVLRMTSGDVLVYDAGNDARRPVALRAIVKPSGQTELFAAKRFKRRRR
jgi:hypothetical protein